jgi:hypothetical protein
VSKSSRGAGLALILLLALALAVVLVPGVLIRPFAAQSPGGVALSFLLRRWSPPITVVALVGVLVSAAVLFRVSPRRLTRAAAGLACLIAAAAAWVARQDYFEWMFRPLPDARFVRVSAASFVQSGDMVLAVARNGDAVAYPVRQLAYHHLVEDAIGGVPIVATY